MKIEVLKNAIYTYMKTIWFNKVDDPEGDNSHPGTKFTASRANKIEDGIELAHERINDTTEFLVDINRTQSGLQFEFLLLKSSVTSGLTSNILVHDFSSEEGLDISGGKFDATNHKVYLP